MIEATDRLESVFAAVVALPTAEERVALLDRECVGDQALRDRVEALLRAHDRAGHLLDRPVPASPEGTADYLPGEHPGTVITGRYKQLEAIGEGGMGTVWVAEQMQPVRRKVALKLIKAGMDSKSVLARFEAERQALAVMDHPNIAKVLDGGLTETGRPFFAMEYVKGVRITEYCDATRMSIPERLHLFAQVCQAVQHAHQKGIIHRDLKPSNILVAPYDDKPVPKVIDFGLAKAMHQSLTERTLHTAHEAVLGTPLYMSPEQAQLNNMDVDTRADIYSLGVLLYELLTGTTPLEKKRFKEAAWDEIRRLIREEEPPRPSTRLSSSEALPSLAAGRHTEPARLKKLVRGELDWIVMKSLEKDRARRYETANGFAMDIQRYLAGEPVLAVPPSAGYRLRKLIRRNKGSVLAAAAVAVAIVAGVGAVVVVQARANRELAGTNEQLAAKNVELAEEQVKVEKRFELAQKAIAKLHTGVSEDMLLKSDQFKLLRTQLLKEAADFYGDMERLLEGHTDAKSRRLLAAGYFQLADLTRRIGSMAEALARHRKALAIRRRLAAEAGADVATRLDVARSLGAMGYISLQTGDFDEALRTFAEQHDVAAALEAESPTEAVLAVLAQSFDYNSLALKESKKSAEALASIEKAVAILRKLVKANPGEIRLSKDLIRSLNNMGLSLWLMGKWAEEQEAYVNARAVLEKLIEANPSDPQLRYSLGNGFNSGGSSLFEAGKPVEALAFAEKARAIFVKLAVAYPAVTNFQDGLALSYCGRGQALSELGRPAEAIAALEKALEIDQKVAEINPTNVWTREFSGYCFNQIGKAEAQMGKPAEAFQAYQKARTLLLNRPRAQSAAPSLWRDLALAESIDKSGLSLSASGKPAEAQAACAEALAIRQKLVDAQPTVPWLRWELSNSHSALGVVQRRTGQFAQAAASFRRAIALVEQLPTLTPRNHYGLACCHAQLAGMAGDARSRVTAEQGVAEAEQAMNLLQQAIAAGYDGLGRLRTDTALDTLRSREDFKKLVKELDAKVAKLLAAPRN
jgi:serine/threonine protein kinase/tetratricopeptide (TPR) repeat protein